MKIGYVRHSATGANFDQQLEAVNRAGCQRIFQDDAGSKRLGLQECLKALKANDVLVISRLDVFATSLHEVIMRVTEIHQRGIKLLSLSEPLNTAATDGGWIYRIFTAMRQCERSLLKERCSRGMKAARANGIKLGARPKLSSEQVAQAQALIAEGHSQKNVADYLKVGSSTLYRRLAREALSVTEGNE